MKKILLWLLAAIVLAVAAGFAFGPRVLERQLNPVRVVPPYAVSARARELERKLTIVDLHADSLLWGRDLTVRATHGDVDIPRLIEANVALQAFTVVTKSPHGLNFQSNSGDSDDILPLAVLDRWPPNTWSSLTERALYQAARLSEMSTRSGGNFTLIRSAADLQQYLARRTTDPAITAGFLGIEGAHALDGRLENLDVLYDAGFRMMSPSHFFDNEFGGSSAGVEKTGLTGLGRELVRRMEARHMLVDVAHAAPRTIDDVLSMATRPVIDSHTGVKATCDNLRNLSDDHIRGIARTGGVVGIAYFEVATCGTDAAAIVRAIRHAVEVGGIDHVGLGSDFDGSVEEPFDTTGIGLIIDALLGAGYSEEDVAKVMGGNVVRVLGEGL